MSESGHNFITVLPQKASKLQEENHT